MCARIHVNFEKLSYFFSVSQYKCSQPQSENFAQWHRWIKKLNTELARIYAPQSSKSPGSSGVGWCPALKRHQQNMSWFDGFADLIFLWLSSQQTRLEPYSLNMLLLAKKQIKISHLSWSHSFFCPYVVFCAFFEKVVF